ncbi:hypothetical protein C8A05DRAFT_17776 [Staphylotrichum tortipilum]|uniref:Uncharacterized protein n=1 Tax=Staphylotrichum tortipilum TaxID=2831512 RepID=A0AAN6MFC6_9PEZI|nr:hypothetical protein C8A05DRAFT_17776 [Staphylotrichum longicolle]
MDPDSCGCVPSADGRLYQPVTCTVCGGSMRSQCARCGNQGTVWYPCPHRRSTGAQYAGYQSSQSSQSSSS